MATTRGRGRPPRSEVFARLEHAMQDMTLRFGGLPAGLEAEPIWNLIWREEAHNSTAIEGNTLVQREVNELLERGVTGSRRKALNEYLTVKDYGEAANWVYRTGIDPKGDWTNGDLLTMTEVRHVHNLCMQTAWHFDPPSQARPQEGPGSFRVAEIQPFASGMQPPSAGLVEAQMSDWVDSVNRLRDNEPFPMVRIASSHAAFERIHPFFDGNGRTGRLLLNLVLVRLAMPPAIIYKRDREQYLQALRRADGGDCGSLAELISRAVLNNLNRLLLPALAGPARLVPIASLAKPGIITHGALRSAAQRGALKASQDPLGQWQSSRVYLEEYLRNRNTRRGRPPLSS